jgi:wyosine [tRNA(Phe)-imidazoG37] synthetase (radical SAM superfamily)
VWLEVLLLAGLTGMPAEARKIGEQAGKIGPARIQLNTACRPPAEEFAFPVPPERMEALKSCFPGTVELICEYGEGFEQAGGAAVGEAEVLALLRRRPCTVEDVAAGLGIHRNEAIKRLQGLEGAGAVVRVKAGARNLYRATGKPREDGSA